MPGLRFFGIMLALLGVPMAPGAFAQSRQQADRAVIFKADKNGQIDFVTPAKTIGCTYTPKGGTPVYKPADNGPELSCDRTEPQYVRVIMTPKSIRRLDNVGDQGCCSDSNVLAHGARWSLPPFTCESSLTGLVCKRWDGRGFSISRTAIKLQ